ncbi:MAG: type I-C CRISPR-associated protein Cas7/Csd2 [Chloroflexi bacterium]|nr:type I-C CRISPR-associated protein Cas7/Csd2 [Chloroflexota bacterium]
MTISERFDFVLLFDVQDGNPNGDPDAGNLPRIDPESGHGLVTDVCLKRKLRNYVLAAKQESEGFELFVKEKAVLNRLIEGAFEKLGINLKEPPASKKDGETRLVQGKAQGSEVESARAEMCRRYFDVRAFGAVMSTGANAGQVRGPIQLTFGRSVDPIVTLEHSITRVAVTKEEDAEEQGGDNRTMGRKNTVPYGLYRAHGFVTPAFAAQTGFSQADLDLLWEAIKNMFDIDRSAARGLMTSRSLIVFKHGSPLGNARAADLFERVEVRRRSEDASRPPRAFADYKVNVRTESMPAGVSMLQML